MVEMLMRRMAFLSSGGIPPEPTDYGYTLLKTITGTQTWTCPKNGWYRITCVGAGGAGGDGGDFYGDPTGLSYVSCGGGAGGGGGSGGCACSVFYILKGETVAFKKTSTTMQASGTLSDVNFLLDARKGNAGSVGANAKKYTDPGAGGSGGSGGSASGGNKKNSKGTTGNTGGAGDKATRNSANTNWSKNTFGVPAEVVYSTFPAGFSGNTKKYGAGGKGGIGGGAYKGTLSEKAAEAGEAGGASAAFIEQAA